MGCWAAWLTWTPVADASTDFVRAIGWKKKLLMRRKTQAIQGIVQPRYRHWLLLRSLAHRNWGDWCLKRNCESNWVENISRWCAESPRLFKKSYSQDAAIACCCMGWLTGAGAADASIEIAKAFWSSWLEKEHLARKKLRLFTKSEIQGAAAMGCCCSTGWLTGTFAVDASAQIAKNACEQLGGKRVLNGQKSWG